MHLVDPVEKGGYSICLYFIQKIPMKLAIDDTHPTHTIFGWVIWLHKFVCAPLFDWNWYLLLCQKELMVLNPNKDLKFVKQMYYLSEIFIIIWL